MRLAQPALSPGSTIVVTGATGFIGSHVADQALAAGYKVRGTTRNLAKGGWARELFLNKYGQGRFELVEVPDMGADNAYDEAAKGASGFIHVAHDMRGSRDPATAIALTVEGALSAAKAAYKAGIRRFVYTSSSFAVTQPKPDVEFRLTTDSFNDEAVEKAKGDDYTGEDVYSASKVHAERALWKWARETHSDFVVNSLNPNGNIGEVMSPAHQGYSTSSQFVSTIFTGDYDAMKDCPPQWFINVQDDAKLHLIALLDPDVRFERVFGTAGPFNLQDIVGCLRQLYPEKTFADWPNKARDLSYFEPTVRAEELLKKAYGHGYTSLLDSVKANADKLALRKDQDQVSARRSVRD